jgi:hypothetical protein
VAGSRGRPHDEAASLRSVAVALALATATAAVSATGTGEFFIRQAATAG